MSFRGFRSVIGTLVVGVLTVAMSGCPTAQVPNTDGTNDEQNDTQQPGTNTNTDNTIPRPIPTVTPDPGETPTTPAPPTGGSSGGSTTSKLSMIVREPSQEIYVRGGTDVTVVFDFIDNAGVAQQVDAVVAVDADNDRAPDGALRLVKVNIKPNSGRNSVTFNTGDLADLLVDGYARFVVGLRAVSSNGTITTSFALPSLIVDAVAPTAEWVMPNTNAMFGRTETLNVNIRTTDNSPHAVSLWFDPDTNPDNGNELSLAAQNFDAGSVIRAIDGISVAGVPAGTYYLLAKVDDKAGTPTAVYAPQAAQAGQLIQIAVSNRLVGEFELSNLTNSSRGGILEGFNFNDLGGSSLAGVPDVNGDGRADLLVASRFGKPYGVAQNGIGYGEAYLIFGNGTRIRGRQPLNATGQSLPGVAFPGVRSPAQSTWTEGLADVTVVPDMDGDERPELVFSFPRTESINLGTEQAVINPVTPDIAGMGSFEWDALLEPNSPSPDVHDPQQWWRNTAQFARGGIVIVSSQNALFQNPDLRNRKGNRVVDLHESGQLFSTLGLGEIFPRPYIRNSFAGQVEMDCSEPGAEPDNVIVDVVTLQWDHVFRLQGPGGFTNDYTRNPTELIRPDGTTGKRPPLAPYRPLDSVLRPGSLLGQFDPCDDTCIVINQWFPWGTAGGMAPNSTVGWFAPTFDPVSFAPTVFHPTTGRPFLYNPNTTLGHSVWTGFIAFGGTGVTIDAEAVGARVLGQAVDDRFGSSVSSDGRWLYIAASNRSAIRAGDNVSTLPQDQRTLSGVVYQLRTDARPGVNGPNVAQLWMEPSLTAEPVRWPYVDAHLPGRRDWTMPTPHQYIIEEVGSIRGNDNDGTDIDADGVTGMEGDAVEPYSPFAERVNVTNGIIGTDGGPNTAVPCVDTNGFVVTGGSQSVKVNSTPSYRPASTGNAAYHMDDVPQIVGPHADARISFVRSVGDMNDDGVDDFAIGSEFVRENVMGGTGPQVGALFIVFGRPVGLEGDMLLERMALPLTDSNRLEGVLLRGSSATDRLARVIDGIGDFNGDGVDDVLIGNEAANNNTGEAIILLGSATLAGSPANGWTVPQLLADEPHRVIRFRGESPGDLAGANVASAGDVDGDGRGDILISAPHARGQRGVVYLIYGTSNLGSDIELAKVGTVELPGAKLIGRNVGDRVGGGEITYPNVNANVFLQPSGQPGDDARAITVRSRGVVGLGDIDGDGRGDFAISAILASPNNKKNAGEVYILYGSGD